MQQYLAKLHLGSLRFSTQTLFLVLAVAMTVVVAAGIIYASFFLVSRVDVATTMEEMPGPGTQFDTAGFEKLKLVPSPQ